MEMRGDSDEIISQKAYFQTRGGGSPRTVPRRSFAFQGALVYNTLPRHVRNLNSRFLFKSNLKEFF